MNGLNNLASLTFSENSSITSIDLGDLNSLNNLNCNNNNQLNSINLNGTSNISNLNCYNNNLLSLNVAGSNSLITLNCQYNQLTSLNFTNCPLLSSIDCSHNQLTNIDLTGLTFSQFLYCNDNLISSFTMSNNVNMYDLHCRNNLLVDFDCSRLRITGNIDLMNNPLQTLNLKNGFDESFNQLFLSVSLGPLSFICEDENQLASLNNQLIVNGWNNIIVNSYCSFTPGGNFNTITGTVTFDANNNGCDANDIFQPNIRVDINDNSTSGASFTNNNGNYTFYTQTGDFNITPSIENPTWYNFSPASAIIPFSNNNNNTVTQNFCLSANGIHPDVEVVIAPIVTARPGFDSSYKVVYKNKGNQTLSGSVSFSYDDSVLDFVSSDGIPTSQSIGLLSFDYTNLLPFENRSYVIVLHVNAPTDIPAVNIGDQLNFTAVVNPIAADENTSDNTFQFHQTVIGSFDPNDITCIEGNVVSPSEIGNYLHYIINFENTGTADAENIVVREVIDGNQFDINSLQLLNSTSTVTARLNGNLAEFIFQNINLHSGGHGNILLKIKSKNTLVQGNSVSKKANIYFDYNFPVETLPENTIFQALSNPDAAVDATITVHPNPTKGIVNINCNNNIKSIQLYDVQGRVLQTNLVNENQTTIDISSQSKGVYFLKIISDKGIGVQKIVRE